MAKQTAAKTANDTALVEIGRLAVEHHRAHAAWSSARNGACVV